jgi:hypothetical protein
MANGYSITKIKGIKTTSLKELFKYISNPEKTTLLIGIEDQNQVGEAVEGTNSVQLVSAHNCFIDRAESEFNMSKGYIIRRKKRH